MINVGHMNVGISCDGCRKDTNEFFYIETQYKHSVYCVVCWGILKALINITEKPPVE